MTTCVQLSKLKVTGEISEKFISCPLFKQYRKIILTQRNGHFHLKFSDSKHSGNYETTLIFKLNYTENTLNYTWAKLTNYKMFMYLSICMYNLLENR